MKKLLLSFLVIPLMVFNSCENEPMVADGNGNEITKIKAKEGGIIVDPPADYPHKLCGQWDDRTKTCVNPHDVSCFCPVAVYGVAEKSFYNNILINKDDKINYPIFFKDNYKTLNKYIHEKHLVSVINNEIDVVFERDLDNNTLYFVFKELNTIKEQIIIVYPFVIK